ncbi:MAG: hypothetical protein ACRDP4_06980 [Nocardioidaceae bacterium]
MVMTGVTDVQALCVAAVNRPSYVSWTLAGLLDPHGTPTPADDGWELGGWRVVVHDGEFVVPSSGQSADDGLRAAVAAAWGWLDQHPGRSIGVGGLGPLGQHR